MAQSQQPPRDGEAEFVRAIVTDPRNVPDVMRLYGYPGASSEENHNRLYLNPDLSQYVEVPTNAILHRMAVPAEQDPNGAVLLWVRRDAALIQKAAPATQALAQYFAGAIAGAAVAQYPWPNPWRGYPWPDPWAIQQLTPYVQTPAVGGAAVAGAAAMPAAAMALLPTGAHHPPWCPPPTLPCTYGPPQCPPTYGISVCCHSVAAPPCTHACLFAAAAAPGAAPAAVAPQLPITLLPACTVGPFVCHTRAAICIRPEAAAGAAAAGAAAMPAAVAPFVPFHTPACSLAFCHPSAAMAFCPPLSAFCQATPVGACGGSIGAACGLQGSIACGGSVACGAGVGQPGFAPAAAAFGGTVAFHCTGLACPAPSYPYICHCIFPPATVPM
jgi:hypothetical protein